MTKITLDRAVAEQALHVATGAGYPVALIAALKAALAKPPINDAEVVYQISLKNGAASSAWIDVDEATYYGARLYSEYKCRCLYAAPPQRPAEPVQEPVAYRFQSPATEKWLLGLEPPVGSRWEVEPLYTAPPQRKPLSEKEIERICAPLGFAQLSPVEVTRAVEAAHLCKVFDGISRWGSVVSA